MDFETLFSEWRGKYDQMSFKDHIEFYNRIYDDFPVQKQFNLTEVLKFLDTVLSEIKRFRVFELGGWDGELAEKALSAYPEYIEFWHNYEICERAVKSRAIQDSRYKGIIPNDFFWNCDIDMKKYNVAILSHVCEHMKKRELINLFLKLIPLSFIYVDIPILQESWKLYVGTHILEERPDHAFWRNFGFRYFYENGSVQFLEREDKKDL